MQDLSRENADVSARLRLTRRLARRRQPTSASRVAARRHERAYPARLGGQRHAADRAVDAAAPGRSGADPQLRSFPQRVRSPRAALPRLLARVGRPPHGRVGARARGTVPRAGTRRILWTSARRLTLVGGMTIDELSRSVRARQRRSRLARHARGTSRRTARSRRLTRPACRPRSSSPTSAPRATRCAVAPARLVVTHSSAELDALRHDVNRWFAAALAAAAARWPGARLLDVGGAQPSARRAGARHIDDRARGAGAGARHAAATTRSARSRAASASMGRRLRASASQLRDAERRATRWRDGAAGQPRHQERSHPDSERGAAPRPGAGARARAAGGGVRRAARDARVEHRLSRHAGAQLCAPHAAHRSPPVRRQRRRARRRALGDASTASSFETRIADGLPPVFGDPVRASSHSRQPAAERDREPAGGRRYGDARDDARSTAAVSG